MTTQMTKRDLISAMEILASDMIDVASMLENFSPTNADELVGASHMIDGWVVALQGEKS